mgnify:CR=1 FL=1
MKKLKDEKKEASQNPEVKYPRPPFPKQRQTYPGTEAAMNPLADHGQHSYMGSGKLKGKKAIITGGDSGIGKAVAIAFAREGADILISYLHDSENEDARDTADLVKKAGQRCILMKGDITREQHCQKIIDKAIKEWNQIDILINNAAFQMARKSLQDIPSTEWLHTFAVNVHSMFYLCKAAVPHMPAGGL